MSRPKLIVGLLALLLAFGAGAWLTWRYATHQAETRTETQATVLLERVREVMQLVTVEGSFSEIYNETNYREVTLYLPIPVNWTFSKSAMLQVKGRVLVGYDMAKVGITVDSTRRNIHLYNLPQPQVLAVEHDIVYRNLEESFFNNFSVEDYTQLNRNAKEALIKQATQSGLLEEADRKGNQLLETVRFLATSAGWTVTSSEAPDSSPVQQ